MNNTKSAASVSKALCLDDRCKRCDVGYLIKDFMTPLMQALTVHVKEYNMRLIESKCLNTAVSIFFLLFGKDALKHTVFCDVRNVQQRHHFEVDNNQIIANKLREDVLRKTKHRYIYYLMLTDGEFAKPDGSTSFFVGHVFLIEKVPWGDSQYYYIYQSYIDQYTFSEYVAKNKSIRVSKEKMAYYMGKINDMVKKKVWDKEFVEFWSDLTKVDSSNMLNGVPQNAFLVCYRKVKYTSCIKNVAEFVDRTLKVIPPNADTAIFGSPEIFDEDSSPLTNGLMRSSLTKLQRTLRRNANF
jgi:hypothetical protein